MIYPDTSTLVPLLISEQQSSIAEKVFAAADRILVSDFAIGEVSSAIARYVRMGDRDADSGRQAVAAFDEWVARRTTPVETQSNDIRVATLFIRRFETGLRLPDALHLAICRRLGAQIFSFDNGMLAAAKLLDIPACDRA